MFCPECECTKPKVLEGRKSGDVYIRVRECRACGLKFQTSETVRVLEKKAPAVPKKKQEILKLAQLGWKQHAIAQELGVSQAHISKIINSKRYPVYRN